MELLNRAVPNDIELAQVMKGRVVDDAFSFFVRDLDFAPKGIYIFKIKKVNVI